MYNLISNALKFSILGVPAKAIIKSNIEECKLNNIRPAINNSIDKEDKARVEMFSPEKKYWHTRVKYHGMRFEPYFDECIFDVGIIKQAKISNGNKYDYMEISPLLEAIYQKYGYDFRQYSKAHITRRIRNRMALSRLEDVSQIQTKVLSDETFARELLQDLSITVTEMFRDPNFYRSLREYVIPVLKTYPFIKIWHAGCATGEEVYSMAIIMQEEGLYDRTTIYATDFNQHALNRAKEGIFSNAMMKEYTINYQLSGGKESFSSYYTSNYDNVIMNQSLKKNIVWANHNLVTDSVFAEVHLVLCRNVLIYFDSSLQNKVQKLFYESLINGGILCLGSKEGLRFTDFHEKYVELDKKQRIFKRRY